jgi:hypothetical protein
LDSEDRDVSLGIPGEPLKWDQLDNEVKFVRCSAKSGDVRDLVSALADYY